ncbi:MAG TPA: gephyrin-like molybdotransferase Glp [Ureibacillus sp.]|nr:gephyrin-like molybdotransferase Glp [Ureibacillus sp.]
MLKTRTPIDVSQAIERIINKSTPIGNESIPIEEALGRILGEPLYASHDVPAFNRSPYDGFAVRSIDTKGASGDSRIQFTVIDHLSAGKVTRKPIGKNEAFRVMTGAELPPDVDAVIMFEQTSQSNNSFTIRKVFNEFENVSLKGEDVKKGEVILEKGTYITPGVIAVLATFGYTQVTVAKRPIVGVFATGSELLDVYANLEPGKIRNSNSPMIMAQLQRLGVETRYLGILPDNLSLCYEKIKEASHEFDAVITTGGVSVGDFDYLPQVYERLGAEILFNKVKMRPGSVTTVAHHKDTLLFGLSGNPSACFVGFELFVHPAMRVMLQSTKPYLPYVKAILNEDYLKANPFTRFILACYESTPEGTFVTPTGLNKSNAISSMAKGNAFIVLPSGTRGFKKGSTVDVLLLEGEGGTDRWMANE